MDGELREDGTAGRTGARIRARRLALGLRQSAVARECGISPSYLVLIEKGRRRIGGALLKRLAAALDVPPARLSEGAPVALVAEIRSVPGAAGILAAEPAEDLAESHPGWARLVADQSARVRALERRVAELGDRLAHDPGLADALHEVISAVAAIRSSASILAEGDLDTNWRRRFLRNIREDAGRLAGGAGALTDWLGRESGGDAGPGAAPPGVDPLAAASAWLGRLEPAALASGDAAGAPEGAAGDVARGALARFARDAATLPEARLRGALAAADGDPLAAAAHLDLPETLVLRRLAVLTRGEGAGLILADASGVPTLALAPAGFPLPRPGAACPAWPLHDARGGGASAAVCAAAGAEGGADGRRWACVAAASTSRPGGIGALPVLAAAMLLQPADAAPATRVVGPGCALCPAASCPVRREPSALAPDRPARRPAPRPGTTVHRTGDL